MEEQKEGGQVGRLQVGWLSSREGKIGRNKEGNWSLASAMWECWENHQDGLTVT